MQQFSTVELVRKLDDVKTAALREPVGITSHNKTKFVLMSAQDYERLKGVKNPHAAYLAAQTPDFILDILKDELAEGSK